jgi:hypothetical protein
MSFFVVLPELTLFYTRYVPIIKKVTVTWEVTVTCVFAS